MIFDVQGQHEALKFTSAFICVLVDASVKSKTTGAVPIGLGLNVLTPKQKFWLRHWPLGTIKSSALDMDAFV